MGLGQFSECGLVYCLLWLRKDITYINIHITECSKVYVITGPNKHLTSVCAIRVYRLGEWWSSLVCLCHGSVYCLPVCQHARSVPACERVILEVSELPWMVSRSPRCPEGLDIVPLCQMAQNPQDCTYGTNWFVMMILCVFLSHVMAYWLCVSPFIVLQSTVLVYL